MIRMVLYLLAVAVAATGLAWLADRPGSLLVNWEGYELETSVFRAVVLFALGLGIAMFLWSLLRQVWSSPALLGHYFSRRRQERGLDALSSGMIAIGAGDRNLATRYAVQARKSLPNEPLTHLLRAQAAQLSGDRTTSRRIFEAMLGSPDTEQLGLRGLFLEAEREGEGEAARQFAERALRLNPKLGWPIEALFDMQCRHADWEGALDTLAAGKRNGHFDKGLADRRRAILLTALAQDVEDANGVKAQRLAVEAHALAPDLIPAAVIAGRQLASRGSTSKAAKIVERTWRDAPHPDLALVYAFARPGDSPRDRLDRIKRLARINPQSAEGPVALATAAIEAREWDEARAALEPLLDGRLTQRVCTLMARIEGEQHKDTGRVREWLARGVIAPRDPAWTADGVVSERWAATSPVTGALGAFQWRVPSETANDSDAERALKKIEELVMLGTPQPGEAASSGSPDTAVAAKSGVGVPSGASHDVREVPAEAIVLEPVKAGGPRVRQPDADRPITVEARPVATGAQATADASRVSPSQAKPAQMQPQKLHASDTRGNGNGSGAAGTDEPVVVVADAGRTTAGARTAANPVKT